MTYILAAVFLQGLVSLVIAIGLSRLRPRWSRRRLAFISAAPLPLIIAGLSAYLFIRTSMMTQEQCGIDACGYAMLAVVFGAIAAMLLYLVGIGLSAAAVKSTKRLEPEDYTDVFS